MPKPHQGRSGRRRGGRRTAATQATPRPQAAPQAVVKPSSGVASPGVSATPAAAKRAPAPPPTLKNKYVVAELRRIGIIAGAMIVFLIVLSFFLK